MVRVREVLRRGLGGGSIGGESWSGESTLCFSRSSLLRGALMMTRRTLEGALKCALRDLRREECSAKERMCQSIGC